MDYFDRLDQRVADGVKNGALTLGALCKFCEGAFPTSVWESLNRQGLAERVHVTGDTEDRVYGFSQLEFEPHPADFDWRFSPETVSNFADLLTGLGDRIALFGAPSVFLALKERGVSATLFDRNPLLQEAVGSSGVHTVDLLRESISGFGDPYDVVLMDPPWYPEDIKCWLENASDVLRERSIVIMPSLSPLLRPSATHEQESLETGLTDYGDLEQVPFSVSYDTPFFEAETLAAAGFDSLGRWRNSKFLMLTVGDPAGIPPFKRRQTDEWGYFKFGRQVVTLKKVGDAQPIAVAPIDDDGWVLRRTVSRRDPQLGQIGLWTSRNRCLRVRGFDRVRWILTKLEDGVTPKEIFSRLPVRPAEEPGVRQILSLIGW
jgi:hypothetical protein